MSRSPARFIPYVVIAVAVGFLVWRRVIVPRLAKAPPPPAPVVERREPPLQSDALGNYVPGYRFTIGRFRFTGFSLRPEQLVTFAQTASGTEDAAVCLDATITPQTVSLRCDYPQVGTVTIEGRFLTRAATARLDVAVLSAVVTVRGSGGEVSYSARDSFTWHPGN